MRIRPVRLRVAAAAGLVAVALAGCGGDPGAALPAADSPPEPFMVALARADGAIVPFAEFDADRWTAPPPAPGPTDMTPTIADRAGAWFADSPHPRGSWRVITPLRVWGQEPQFALTPGDAVELDSHCQRAWGLISNLEGAATTGAAAPGEIGVAFSGGHDALFVAEMDAIHPDSGRAVAFLQPHFVAAEAREAQRRAGAGSGPPRPIGAGAAETPLSLTSLHYVGLRNGAALYAFEAMRTYPRAADTPDVGCDEATVMTGWLSDVRSGGFTLLSSDIALTDCDRKETTFIQPLAAVELGGRLFIITVDQHYESESYSIYDVSPAAVTRVLTVDGGGC